MSLRMDTTLATNADAQLILKLYELRTEAEMRAARKWVNEQFWPESAQQVFDVLRASGTQENAWFRQVVSYWEMAAAFVLHGALDPELFLNCNGENIFILGKVHPFLQEIRAQSPYFLTRTEELTNRFETAKRRLENAIEAGKRQIAARSRQASLAE